MNYGALPATGGVSLLALFSHSTTILLIAFALIAAGIALWRIR